MAEMTQPQSTIDPPSVGSPMAWNDTDSNRPVPFWSSVRADLIAQLPPNERQRSPLGWALAAAKIGISSPGFKVALVYRFNHALVNHVGPTGRIVAGVINKATHIIYHSAISPTARLHGGLVLPHPQGITIGTEVVVGPRTWIYQNVTMGGTGGRDGQPNVGADCRIYTGAVIVGPVVVGDEVVVSPNSLVQRSVPSGSLAVGVPAAVFPKFSKAKAS